MDLPHAPSTAGQLKMLAHSENKNEIDLLWPFKSRQMVSAVIYFFAFMEEAGGLKQAVSAVSRTIHVCTSSLGAHSKKKKIQQALKQKQAHSGRNQVCDAHSSAHGNPNCSPLLLA